MLNKVLVALLLLACVTLPCVADEKDNQEVLKAEHALCKAFEKGDLAYIKAHESDDYTLTLTSGEITTRQDDLDDITKRGAHWTTFENRDMKVRTYGHHTAVVTGKTVVKGTISNKAVDIAVLFTDTFAKIDGQWILVAGHVTRIKN